MISDYVVFEEVQGHGARRACTSAERCCSCCDSVGEASRTVKEGRVKLW